MSYCEGMGGEGGAGGLAEGEGDGVGSSSQATEYGGGSSGMKVMAGCRNFIYCARAGARIDRTSSSEIRCIDKNNLIYAFKSAAFHFLHKFKTQLQHSNQQKIIPSPFSIPHYPPSRLLTILKFLPSISLSLSSLPPCESPSPGHWSWGSGLPQSWWQEVSSATNKCVLMQEQQCRLMQHCTQNEKQCQLGLWHTRHSHCGSGSFQEQRRGGWGFGDSRPAGRFLFGIFEFIIIICRKQMPLAQARTKLSLSPRRNGCASGSKLTNHFMTVRRPKLPSTLVFLEQLSKLTKIYFPKPPSHLPPSMLISTSQISYSTTLKQSEPASHSSQLLLTEEGTWQARPMCAQLILALLHQSASTRSPRPNHKLLPPLMANFLYSYLRGSSTRWSSENRKDWQRLSYSYVSFLGNIFGQNPPKTRPLYDSATNKIGPRMPSLCRLVVWNRCRDAWNLLTSWQLKGRIDLILSTLVWLGSLRTRGMLAMIFRSREIELAEMV